jgi:hypothetical protein
LKPSAAKSINALLRRFINVYALLEEEENDNEANSFNGGGNRSKYMDMVNMYKQVIGE